MEMDINFNILIMKQTFKHTKLTERKVINSILRFNSLATLAEQREGMNWYNDANNYCRELAARFNVSVSQVAGIIAAFSPQCGWLENKRFALSFLMQPNKVVKTQIQTQKAQAILKLHADSDIFNALSIAGAAWKTKAFFLNIVNPNILTDVTIDRHAIAVCIQQPSKTEALSEAYGKLTLKQYRFFESCYIKASLELDIHPHQLQAITWTVYRRLRELRQYDNAQGWQPIEGGTEDLPF
jgi:hypothetical protein